MVKWEGGGGLGYKNNLGLFFIEFYPESAGFYLMSKFQAVFEILCELQRKSHELFLNFYLQAELSTKI